MTRDDRVVLVRCPRCGGADDEDFARFEAGVRREYAWVEDAAYATGRAAVLRRFLARPRIYATGLFQRRLEDRARVNLEAALRALSAPPSDDPRAT